MKLEAKYNEEALGNDDWTDGVEYTTLQGYPTVEEVETIGCAKGLLAVDTEDGIRCVRHLPSGRTVATQPSDETTMDRMKEIAEDLAPFIGRVEVNIVAIKQYLKTNDLV